MEMSIRGVISFFQNRNHHLNQQLVKLFHSKV
uniref:Uncharacterized protein n=1 Tax=Anguilla anguilla TaxID=7936 RepID=A0A0E9R5N3_ANGAN